MAHRRRAESDKTVRFSTPKKVGRRILVTGAAGTIGRYYARHAPGHHHLRLMVHSWDERAEALKKYGTVVQGDLSSIRQLTDLCDGVDTVIHLGGEPSADATWSSLLPANIVGTYHLFVAAKTAGVRRVIYASSIHAVSGYPIDVQVKTSEPVNPGDLYGVSKCFGEALGRYMAEQEGLSVIALRIGAFQPISVAQMSKNSSLLDAFVSERDLHQLIVRCVDDDRLKFAIFHGLSNNRFKRLDITDAREAVGYAPQDDLAAENPQLKRTALAKKPIVHNRAEHPSGLREELELSRSHAVSTKNPRIGSGTKKRNSKKVRKVA